jgi:alkaline phosphatase D
LLRSSATDHTLYLIGIALLAIAASVAAATPTVLVAVGEVTPTSAVLWVRGAGAGTVTVAYGVAGSALTSSASVAVTPATDLTGQMKLSGLAPGTRHAYRAQSNGITADGEFVTAPPPEASARVRFVWSGDLGGGKFCRPVDGGYKIFRAMAASRPDFFLFVGDTIYADHRCGGPDVVAGADFVATTLPGYHVKHRYNREDPAAAAFYASTAVLPIWDDHEVRNDFSGPGEPLMTMGRQAFFDYWPIARPAEEPGRLYRRFQWGRLLDVFILDTRQYRSSNRDPDGPGKTMLGEVQRRWLLDGVTASSASWKVIVSSVPLSVPTGPPTAHDSWSNASVFGVPEDNTTGFAFERDLIVRALRDRAVKNVVFIAADVHHAELIRHHPTSSFSFHEFIAGPLSAPPGRPRPLDQALNPRSLFARGGVNNFGEITVERDLLTVRIIDDDGKMLFTHAIGPE